MDAAKREGKEAGAAAAEGPRLMRHAGTCLTYAVTTTRACPRLSCGVTRPKRS